MQFKRLEIERQIWGEFQGQCVGKAQFDGAFGSVSVTLSPELAARILVVCADALVNVSREAANLMTQEIIDLLPTPTKPAELFADKALATAKSIEEAHLAVYGQAILPDESVVTKGTSL